MCLFEEEEEDNKLITPCICKGTMKYIHIGCLKEWVNNKRRVIQHDYMTTYVFSWLECELCKTKLPDKIVEKGKFHEIIEYDIPQEGDYLILESF